VIEQMRIAGPGLQDALGWLGQRVDDVHGVTIGTLADIWIDPGTGEPRWLLIRSRFGSHRWLIPLADAFGADGHVWVAYHRSTVREAPETRSDELTTELAARLDSHYAAARDDAAPPVSLPTPRPAPESAHRLG
jgi:PRC-barrel domain